MVELRPWIDLTPTRQGAATASQLTQADRAVTGTVSEILDDGTVAVSIDGSTEPDVVVPSASGITAVGASVRVSRDSSGRAVEASIPESIPPGASTAPVGVTGDWLMGLDALTATLDGAQGELSDAQTALKAHLAELGIDTDNVTVTDELWARLAVFAQVTTDMLIAGNATITNEMIVNTLVGKILQGGLLLAGGGDLPQVLVGPLSGTPGTGDRYGVYLTTPNNNASGSAALEVTPTGPMFSMLDGSGNTILSMDKTNGLKVLEPTSGSLVGARDMMFGLKSFVRTTTINSASTSGGGWGSWTFDDFSATYTAPSSNALMFVAAAAYASSYAGLLRVAGILRDSDTDVASVSSTNYVWIGSDSDNPLQLNAIGRISGLTIGKSYSVRVQQRVRSGGSGQVNLYTGARSVFILPC